MATKSVAGEMQDDERQHQNQGDDPEHVHPAWCALFGFHNGNVYETGVELNQRGWRLADDQ